MELNLDQTVEKAIDEIKQYEGVEGAGKNICENICDSIQTNDTYSNKLKENLDRINLEDAWNCHDWAGFHETWIAVLDTGFRMTHEDLKGRFIDKYTIDVTKKDTNGKYIKLSSISKPYDNNHGTLVAGVIGANADNKKGIYGAASSHSNFLTKMIGVKVTEKNKGEVVFKSENILKGVKHAVDSGAEVISMSISFDRDDICLKQAAEYAEAGGVVFITSAGNEGNSVKRYPAAYNTVIGVGGIDVAKGTKADFSTYGGWVNIIAPATNFWTTDVKNDLSYISGVNGTSFSTPLVASTVGLMISINPGLTPKQVREYLNSHSYPVNSSYFKCGLLNAGFAVQKAKYEDFKDCQLKISAVTANKGEKIKIKWKNNDVFDPEKVQIYRATSKNGTYKKIGTVDGRYDENAFTDSTCKAGVHYFYKIRASMKYGDINKYTAFSEIKSIKAIK